jgi:hypothetical protein
LISVTKKQRDEMETEAESLVRFVETDAKSYAVKWVE